MARVTQKEIKQRQRIQDRMQRMNEYHNKTYDYVKDQLEFASGDQWQTNVRAERQKDGRPTVVLNLTKSYINRVVNPVRMNPIGVNVGTDNKELTDLLSGIIRQVEVESRMKEVTDVAYENAVTAGLGWYRLGTDYIDDDSLEQKVTVDIVRNPMSCWLDPYSKRADGSDAEFGAFIEYIDQEAAVEQYGEDAVGQGLGGVDIFEHWTVPEDSVADFTYYELESEKIQRYWYENGTTTDGQPNPNKPYVKARTIEKKQVRAIRYIGNKKIEWIKDSQRMVNYYGSNELELASLAPKSPWVIAEGQIEGYEEDWLNANRIATSALTYKPDALGGQMVPPPMRADNQAQTGGLMASRQKAQEDMGREIGIFDNMLGQVEAANESGKAALLRANQGELPTAHYLQNLEQSIAQVGRVMLYLLAWVGDTPRMVGVRDAQGQTKYVETTLSEILTPKVLKNASIETTAGPAYESRRRESINAIMQMGQIMPEKMGVMADILVENMDAPGSIEIAERLRKLPDIQALLDEGEGPTKEELEQQLQGAQAQMAQQQDTMGKMEGIIKQLQARIIADDKDRQADMAKTLIKEEGALARERMKQVGEDERAALKIEADAESDMRSLAGDVLKAEQKADIDLTANFTAEDYVPPVAGPLSTDKADTAEVSASIDKTLGK